MIQRRVSSTMKARFYRILMISSLLITTVPTANGWDWWQVVVDPLKTSKNTLTMEEVSILRVREIKRRLVRKHGYGADEVARILDKKELIQALAFEEHKVRLKELEQTKRDFTWKMILITLFVGAITLFWPLLRNLWEVVSVNFVVYTDRKMFEAQRCWQYNSISGCLVVLFMAALDIVQLWMSLSILLSWFMTSKYFFPMPSVPIHPATLMGGPIAQGPLARYGINLAPMLLSFAFRYIHGWLERLVGFALKNAQVRQRKQRRAQETPEERAARRAAKRAAKEAERHHGQMFQEPRIQLLTPDEMREAAALAAEKRRSDIESKTPLDDLD